MVYRDSRGLLPNVRPKVDEVLSKFTTTQIPNVWGPGPNPDHNNLRCCDYMINNIASGDAVAQYNIANKDRLGVQGIIWNHKVMGFPENGGQYAGPSGQWRPYSGASPHTDHPHIQYSNEPIKGGSPVGGGGTIVEINSYDDNARKLGLKAIGTVESRLTYDAINYSDPVTVGVVQWYGPRAATILGRMRDENPSAWTGVASSLTADMSAHDLGSSWWTGRWLTKDEGQSIRPVLIANKPIQNSQFYSDLDGYVATATRLGMDKDNNTLAVLFFASMEHQGPLYARQVLAAVGPNANLDRIHSGAVSHPVLGRYKNRQDEVKRILLARDISGVDGAASEGIDPEDGGTPGNGSGAGSVKYVQRVGDAVHLKMSDGTTTIAQPTGGNLYLPKRDASTEGRGEVKPPDNDSPDVPPSTGQSEKETAIKDFLTTKIGQFKYGQGPGRMTPETSGYTDCSALLWWAFRKVLGITLGTWTGTQLKDGKHVAKGSGRGPLPYAQMRVGDLVLYDWGSYTAAYDHVEMYYGGTQVIGHGGPGVGPQIRDANGINQRNNPLRWEIRRVIT